MKIERCADLHDFKKEIHEFEKALSTRPEEKTLAEFSSFLLANADYRGDVQKEMDDFKERITAEVPEEIALKINKAVISFITISSDLPVIDDFQEVAKPNIKLTNISPEELRTLLKTHPHISSIDLPVTATAEHIQVLIDANLTNLRKLDLAVCTKLTTEDLGRLFSKYTSTLEYVDVSHTQVKGPAVEILAQSKLKRFFCGGCYEIPSKALTILLEQNKSTLEEVMLSDQKVLDSHIDILADARNLKVIRLNFCDSITNSRLVHLFEQRKSTLEFVEVLGSNIKDSALQALAGARIRTLAISVCKDAGPGLTALLESSITTIKSLNIMECGIKNQLIEALKGATDLEILNLTGCRNLTSEGFIPLFENCKENIQGLYLTNTNVKGTDLFALRGAPKLQEIVLRGCENLEMDIDTIKENIGKHVKIIN